MYSLVKIILKNGVPTHNNKPVVLSQVQLSTLVGKGDRSSTYIHKRCLKYQENSE